MADEITQKWISKILFQAGAVCMALAMTVLFGAVSMLAVSILMMGIGLWFGGRELILPVLEKLQGPIKEDRILEKKKKEKPVAKEPEPEPPKEIKDPEEAKRTKLEEEINNEEY
jgi:hypothetical protein